MIEDISTTKDIVKEEQVNTCDICHNKISTILYLNVSGSSKTPKSKENTQNDDFISDKYYNVCLNCVEKIRDLMKYNYGFNGKLIQFFESLTEKELK